MAGGWPPETDSPGHGAAVSARRRTPAAGFASVEALVGAALGLATVVAALSLAAGLARVAGRRVARDDGALAARWALDRIARDLAAAGRGVDTEGTPDEPLELVEPWALAVRGDRDADDPAAALDPEARLDPAGGFVATGNDEVVAWLRRTAGGARRALFEADLDSGDRIDLPDGRKLARRDGAVETIDAGPSARTDDTRAGVLYRVHFVDDARRFGSGRFRVVEPVLSGVTAFRVTALDASGAAVPACGGRDDPPARACRSRVRALRLEIGIDAHGGTIRFERVLPLGEGRTR